MRKISEILRLHFENQHGQRQIGRALQTGQSTVHDYLARFAAAGLNWPLPETITDDELESLLFPHPERHKPGGDREEIPVAPHPTVYSWVIRSRFLPKPDQRFLPESHRQEVRSLHHTPAHSGNDLPRSGLLQ